MSNGTCPICESDNICGDAWDVDLNSASQETSCNDCGAQWYDIYTFVDREMIYTPQNIGKSNGT